MRSVYAVFGCLVVAVARALEGARQPRLQHRVRGGLHLAGTCRRTTSSRRSGPGRRARCSSGRWCSRSSPAWRSCSRRGDTRDLMPYVAAVTSAVVAFFVSVMLFAAEPVRAAGLHAGRRPRAQPAAAELGDGDPSADALPRLHQHHHPVRVRHRRAALAAARHRLDPRHPEVDAACRWLFLSIGITLGMWWAYVELGWGGYWAWDPVENASFLPWLTMTAFLHSVMIQEKRGMLQALEPGAHRGRPSCSASSARSSRAAASSRACTASPSRTSATSSSRSSWSSPCSRSRCSTPAGRCSRPRSQLESMVSREAAFLFNNLLLVGIAFSVLWGTLFPILSRGGAGHQDHGRPAVLQQGERPARPAAAGAHRHRAADRVAEGVDGQPAAPVRRARWPPAS